MQIVFNGQKTIDHVVVASRCRTTSRIRSIQPSAIDTFSLYGVTDFNVQTWNGCGMGHAGNGRPATTWSKRTVNFAPVTTDRIRVNVTGAMQVYSRIVEIEAWTTGVAPPPTSTAVTSSLNPSTSGTSVTFTATIAGAAPTGTVGFTDNGNSIATCAAVNVNAAKATCTTSTLTVGSHSIVATYSGDVNNAGSVSPALTQTVNAGAQINVALASNGGVASASSTYVQRAIHSR